MNEDFTWSRLKIFFPEYFKDDNSRVFSKAPKVENGKVSFKWADYGVEVYLNQKIPQWLTGITSIDNIYHALAKMVIRDHSELEGLLPIIDGWRPNLKYLIGNGWYLGHLEKDIEFIKRKDGISYLDYWVMNEKDIRGIPIHPTDKILAIGKLPRDSLNEKWLRVYDFAKYIFSQAGKNCNEIMGSSIIDCATIANEIYDSVPELEKLKIEVPYPIH
jgi:hypothetical protein